MDPGSQIKRFWPPGAQQITPRQLSARREDAAAPSPLPSPKPSPAASPAKSSPWCGAPTPGRCWRSSGRQSGDRSGLRRRAARGLSGPPPWTASSPFGGTPPLPGADPVVLYQDLVVALDPARRQQPARRCTPSSSRPWARSRARASSMSAPAPATIARSWPSWSTPPARSRRSSSTRRWPSGPRPISGRPNVRVVDGDGARQPRTPADGVYVIFVVARPADRWIENLARDGRLVFPLGVPGPKRPNSGGRHSDRDAARAISTAYFVCAEGEFEAHREELERLRAAFEAGGIDTVRSLIWKRPALSDRCWFAGKDWALSRDETP
jgi:protein-L-isoaspartate(D-aspartate) O-methyltransferase